MWEKLFFFGTGEISTRYTSLFDALSIEIEGYIDNDRDKWGTSFGGKRIYSPDILYKMSTSCVFIACAARDEIMLQLAQMNLENRNVSIAQIITCHSWEVLKQVCPDLLQPAIRSSRTILIDNLGGSWGGAEDWSHIVSISLIKRQRAAFVIEDTTQPYIIDLEKNIIRINTNRKDDYQVYAELMRQLMEKKPFVLFNVRNSVLLWAAATIKMAFPKEVAIVSSILNDTVYREFCEWEESTDAYLCISSRIREKLLSQLKFAHKKRGILCRTPFVEKIRKVDRKYTERVNSPIQIGYPCRLVREQKRSDLIPAFIDNLEKKQINYQLNIVGDGICAELIKKYIDTNHLNAKVIMYGKLSRAELYYFLDHQDVYINFSEYEGTSLTMLEAMASGCVPVVTDVSGVRDFIENGSNGWIADIGDLDKMTDYIVFLDQNRLKLSEYGRKCMHIVQEKCQLSDYMDDIESLIESL